MSKQITLFLPDEVLTQAEALADRSGREVADVLTEALEVSFDPLGLASQGSLPMHQLSDSQVLAAARLSMLAEDDRRLSELLDRQREGALSVSERETLRNLMHLYQTGLLQKAEGVAEAVRRGLMALPTP